MKTGRRIFMGYTAIHTRFDLELACSMGKSRSVSIECHSTAVFAVCVGSMSS
jgi:hypothetical protein